MKIRATKVACLLLVIILCAQGLNRIFGVNDNVHTATTFRQFYKMGYGTIDAIFIGSSAIHEFVIPSIIFDETGITTFDLATGNMPILTYKFLMEECERVQNPEIYFIDLRTLALPFLDNDNFRRVVDNMEWATERIELINYAMSNIEKFHPNTCDPKLSYLLPFIKYHTRWNQLSREDFVDAEDCFFGYIFNSRTECFDKDEVFSRMEVSPQPISEEAEYYLNDLLDFCDNFEKPIVFVETPSCVDLDTFANYRYVENYVEERGYTYWNLNENIQEMEINYNCDWGDPLHVNSDGAQKFSKYLAKELSEKYNLKDHRNDENYNSYYLMSEHYSERYLEDKITNLDNFNEYLNCLSKLDPKKYSVFMAVKDIQGFALNKRMVENLEALGFDQTEILLERVYHSFVGIIGLNESKEKIVYQEIGNNEETSVYKGRLGGKEIQVESKVLEGGNMARIEIDNCDYSINQRGFNIVVYDNKDSEIVDSVCFDTHTEEIKCYR